MQVKYGFRCYIEFPRFRKHYSMRDAMFNCSNPEIIKCDFWETTEALEV